MSTIATGAGKAPARPGATATARMAAGSAPHEMVGAVLAATVAPLRLVAARPDLLPDDDGSQQIIHPLDKIAAGDGRMSGGVSREGVQRDLLPLVEGTTVATKYGPVKTDHVLFIASGAFHVSKPSDLLPELQGRLPIRVELRALERDDFRRILTEPQASLIRQYTALMATEGVTVGFTDDGIAALARIAAEVNSSVENIGARRLSTVMEKLLEDISWPQPLAELLDQSFEVFASSQPWIASSATSARATMTNTNGSSR